MRRFFVVYTGSAARLKKIPLPFVIFLYLLRIIGYIINSIMKKTKLLLLNGRLWHCLLLLLILTSCSITTNHYYCSEHKNNAKTQAANKPVENKKNTDE